VTPDLRTPNAALIKFEREDHTLGNLLRSQLLQDSRVVYAAYKVEHPLFANFVMRVQTEDGYTPREALKNACSAVIAQLGRLAERFKTEYDLKSMLADAED
jgi:DNA-directed RNA polymerase II subunit RPB11